MELNSTIDIPVGLCSIKTAETHKQKCAFSGFRTEHKLQQNQDTNKNIRWTLGYAYKNRLSAL